MCVEGLQNLGALEDVSSLIRPLAHPCSVTGNSSPGLQMAYLEVPGIAPGTFCMQSSATELYSPCTTMNTILVLKKTLIGLPYSRGRGPDLQLPSSMAISHADWGWWKQESNNTRRPQVPHPASEEFSPLILSVCSPELLFCTLLWLMDLELHLNLPTPALNIMNVYRAYMCICIWLSM